MSKSPSSHDCRFILICKDALGHILVNLTLLEFYGLAFENTDDCERNDCERHLLLSEEHLDIEIERLFELAYSNFQEARKESVFSCRRLVSTWRTMSLQVRNTADYHKFWDRLDEITSLS